MKDTAKLAVIQPRVSSKEQRESGYSVPAQLKLLTEYANRHGFEVARVYAIVETASKPAQRKTFREMMAFIVAQEIKVLIVEKVDRLTRNFKDMVAMDEWLEQDGDRQVHFVKDSLVLHRSSRSQEKLNWGIRVVMAKNYIDNLTEEIEKGRRAKLEEGGLPGRHPIGYKAVGKPRHKRLLIDRQMGPLVQQLFTLYLEPMQSISTVTADMKRLGLRTHAGRSVPRSRIWMMLSNKFYVGKIPWKGEIYDGNHPPLVSVATFNAVQRKLTGGNTPKFIRHDALFRGLVRCSDCGSTVSWELHKGRYYGKCKDYRPCTRRTYIREDRLEQEIRALLAQLPAPWPEVISWVQRDVRARYRAEVNVREVQVDQLRKRQARLKSRLKLAYEDRLDGRVTVAQYDELAERMNQELAHAGEQLSAGDDEWLRIIERNLDYLALCQRAGELFDDGDKAQRRELLSLLFSNLVLEGQKLAPSWDETAEVILAAARKDRELDERLEPRDHESTKRKEAHMKASYSLWCNIENDLRTLEREDDIKRSVQVRNLLGR